MQLLASYSPAQKPAKTRLQLAQRALGATVVFFTAAEPRRRRRGKVTFADVDTLHLLVEDAEGDELVPLTQCRVLRLRQKPVCCCLTRLNVWRYGEGWKGVSVSDTPHPDHVRLEALVSARAA